MNIMKRFSKTTGRTLPAGRRTAFSRPALYFAGFARLLHVHAGGVPIPKRCAFTLRSQRNGLFVSF